MILFYPFGFLSHHHLPTGLWTELLLFANQRPDPLCDLADGDGDGTCRNGEAGDDQLPQEIHRGSQGDWLLDDDLRWFGTLGLPDADRGSFRNNRMT